MKVRWPGIVLVAVLVIGVVAIKRRIPPSTAPSPSVRAPSVVLVADFREADASNDACAEIIRTVRQASARGVQVLELPPDSNSDMLRQHHVVTIPTVLVLGQNGAELVRFEGENTATVKAIQSRLAQLPTKAQ